MVIPQPRNNEIAIRFANIMVATFGHEQEFSFELLSMDYDPIKLVLEEFGYSVHRSPSQPNIVIAYRTKPDTAPVVRELQKLAS